jgi:RNA polymerase sigma-70 factor (ECF subfamily)
VARNRAIDYLRKHRNEVMREDLDAVRAGEGDLGRLTLTPADNLVAEETRKAVLDALAELPSRERDLLMLRFFGDRTFKEIAAIVRRPLGTVLWQVHRSLAKMRRRIAWDANRAGGDKNG